jgi:hypothetical protein
LIETTEQGKCAFTEKKALKKEDSRFELFKTLKIWKWTFLKCPKGGFGYFF